VRKRGKYEKSKIPIPLKYDPLDTQEKKGSGQLYQVGTWKEMVLSPLYSYFAMPFIFFSHSPAITQPLLPFHLIFQTGGLTLDTTDDDLRSIFGNDFIIVEHFELF